MTYFAPKSEDKAALKDYTTSFDDADLALSGTDFEALNGSLRMMGVGTTASRTADDSSTSVSQKEGVIVNPNTALDGVEARISANTSNATRAYLQLHSDGTILDEADVSGLSAGDTVRLYADLNSGTEYRVVLDAEGNSYTRGYLNSGSYPYSTTDVDVTTGVFGGSTAATNVPNINDVTALTPTTSATAYAAWEPVGEAPPDAVGWDVAYFKRTLDGESVDVYAEEAQGSPGWTEVAGPMKRGDTIPADPENDVRFRIEFSRSNTANNPTLDSLVRRYKL